MMAARQYLPGDGPTTSTEEKGGLGLVARVIRTAIEHANGMNLQRIGDTPDIRRRRQEQERAWLRDGGWEPMVSLCGVDPVSFRRELERRLPWMRKGP